MSNPSDSQDLKILAREIGDRDVKALFDQFVETYSNLHDEIRLESTTVEVRFFYNDQFLCRLAPYRELFHAQVGDGPVWETRVRTRAGLQDTIDRALHRFLRVYAAEAR